MSNTEAMRAEFEAWATANGYDTNAQFQAGRVNQYLATEHAWEGWQAASAGKAELLALLKEAREVAQDCAEELGCGPLTGVGRFIAKADALISRATGEQDTGRESNE